MCIKCMENMYPDKNITYIDLDEPIHMVNYKEGMLPEIKGQKSEPYGIDAKIIGCFIIEDRP